MRKGIPEAPHNKVKSSRLIKLSKNRNFHVLSGEISLTNVSYPGCSYTRDVSRSYVNVHKADLKKISRHSNVSPDGRKKFKQTLKVSY